MLYVSENFSEEIVVCSLLIYCMHAVETLSFSDSQWEAAGALTAQLTLRIAENWVK